MFRHPKRPAALVAAALFRRQTRLTARSEADTELQQVLRAQGGGDNLILVVGGGCRASGTRRLVVNQHPARRFHR